MATDLEANLAGEAAGLDQNEDLYCWPWFGVVVSIQQTEPINVKRFSKYKPLRMQIFGDVTGEVVILKFGNDLNGFKNAMEFEKSFKAQGCGKKEWIERRASPGSSIYGWFAREDDYKSEGRLGSFLRSWGKLKTISELIRETTKGLENFVSNLVNEMDLTNENLDQVHVKYNEKTLAVKRALEEKGELHRGICEETRNVQSIVKRVLNEQEMLSSELESKRQRLDSRSKELNRHEALILRERKKLGEEKTKNVLRSNTFQISVEKQRATDENAQRLVEELKREKEADREKILELARKLEEEKKKNDLTNSNLQMAIEEQRKTNESVLRLAEEQRKTNEYFQRLAEEQKNDQRNSARKTAAEDYWKADPVKEKRENEAELKKILEEEKRRDEKKRLDMEIKDLRRKLGGMKHTPFQKKLLGKIQELETILQEIFMGGLEINILQSKLRTMKNLGGGTSDVAFVQQKLQEENLKREKNIDKKNNLVMEIEELKSLLKL